MSDREQAALLLKLVSATLLVMSVFGVFATLTGLNPEKAASVVVVCLAGGAAGLVAARFCR